MKAGKDPSRSAVSLLMASLTDCSCSVLSLNLRIPSPVSPFGCALHPYGGNMWNDPLSAPLVKL